MTNPKRDNPEEQSSFIQYLDANNLYGWAMSQPMPTGNFRWGSEEDKKCWAKLEEGEEEGTGDLLEVDLEVPKHLHDCFKDYPLAPEKLIPSEYNGCNLSPLQKELISANKGGTPKVPKLLCTFNNKSKYRIHYRNLKLCLSLGLKLIKIHRMILFDQSPWFKKYIELNTSLRTKSKNNFEKDFSKLMNNSVFGISRWKT